MENPEKEKSLEIKLNFFMYSIICKEYTEHKCSIISCFPFFRKNSSVSEKLKINLLCRRLSNRVIEL